MAHCLSLCSLGFGGYDGAYKRQGHAKSKCGKFYVFWHWFVVFPFGIWFFFLCPLSMCLVLVSDAIVLCYIVCECAVNPISQDSNVAVTHCATQRKDKIYTESPNNNKPMKWKIETEIGTTRWKMDWAGPRVLQICL